MTSVPGFPTEIHIKDLEDSKLQLAFQEGHDADIPTNEGLYVPPKAESATAATDDEKRIDENGSALEKDVEKGDASVDADDKEIHTTGNGASQEEEEDPNAVWWDGPDDPKNPMNWTPFKKWSNMGLLSILTLLTPLGSSMFAPGVPNIMREFHSTSEQLATFVVSVYVLGFALGPMFIAPMSEMYGRTPCYNIGNILFVVFSMGSALSKNMGMLIAFRFLMGLAGSTPVTIGGGTIADMIPVEGRGRAMALWAMGPLLGPVLGPVCGGYLVQAKGWRWVFWLLTIVSGAFSILSVIFLNETYAPVLLERKAARLRKETGNQALHSKLSIKLTKIELLKRAVIRPTKMLVTIPIIFFISLYVAVAFGTLYLLFTTFTFVFEENYGFSSGSVGLTYIPCGVGMILGMGILGYFSDRILKGYKDRGVTLTPEMRLPYAMTIPGGIMLPIGLFWYGWAAEKHAHWIVPLLGCVLVGVGLIANMMCCQTYLIDAYTIYAASAIAANTVLRSLVGATLPLGGLQMYSKLGLGWGNSLIAFIALALIPVPVLFKRYGERIRARFPVNF